MGAVLVAPAVSAPNGSPLRALARAAGAGVKAIDFDVVAEMFDYAANTAFAVKDIEHRYLSANRAMLQILRIQDIQQLLSVECGAGVPAPDAAPLGCPELRVLQYGVPVRNRLASISYRSGSERWILMSRWPLWDDAPSIAGIVCVDRTLPVGKRRVAAYQRTRAAIAHMQSQLGIEADLRAAAEAAGVSLSQLDRYFAAIFGCTPSAYLTKLRLENSLDLLRNNYGIAEAALACGFSDQSAFTRRFRAVVGVTPRAFQVANSRHTRRALSLAIGP